MQLPYESKAPLRIGETCQIHMAGLGREKSCSAKSQADKQLVGSLLKLGTNRLQSKLVRLVVPVFSGLICQASMTNFTDFSIY